MIPPAPLRPPPARTNSSFCVRGSRRPSLILALLSSTSLPTIASSSPFDLDSPMARISCGRRRGENEAHERRQQWEGFFAQAKPASPARQCCAGATRLVKHAADGQRALGDGRHLVGQLHGCTLPTTTALYFGCSNPANGPRQTGRPLAAAQGRRRRRRRRRRLGRCTGGCGRLRRCDDPMRQRCTWRSAGSQSRHSVSLRPPHLAHGPGAVSDRSLLTPADRCGALPTPQPLPRPSDRGCACLPAAPALLRCRSRSGGVQNLLSCRSVHCLASPVGRQPGAASPACTSLINAAGGCGPVLMHSQESSTCAPHSYTHGGYAW